MKKLKDSDKNLYLENTITFDEALEVVNSMPDSAPGPNGLTSKFFKKYFEFFGRDFVNLLNDIENPLSDTFNKITIKLIPKNNNIEKTVNGLRLISLTNFEYRIFTKILTNRLGKISNIILSDSQTCTVLGRRMNDNITLIRDLIEDAKNKIDQCVSIICGDQEKAFDMISYNYIFALLDHVNFGFYMTRNIKRLYASSYARVTFNKLISDKIEIKSGIKQGSALTMFLYVLAIDELLIRIKNNENIKGYKINTMSKSEFKVSAYADDVTGCTVDDESTEEFFKEFESWGKISGAKLNKNKTKIIKINQNQERVIQKILGIEFDNFGITKENIIKRINKMKQAVAIWNSVKLN